MVGAGDRALGMADGRIHPAELRVLRRGSSGTSDDGAICDAGIGHRDTSFGVWHFERERQLLFCDHAHQGYAHGIRNGKPPSRPAFPSLVRSFPRPLEREPFLCSTHEYARSAIRFDLSDIPRRGVVRLV